MTLNWIALSCMFIIMMPVAAVAAGPWVDAPLERDFLRIPRRLDVVPQQRPRWLWLSHKGYGEIEIILGRGRVHAHNRILSLSKVSDGRDAWYYAYFVRITPGHFFEKNADGALYFATVPLDIASNYVRDVLLFKLESKNFLEVGRIAKYQCSQDQPLFRDSKSFLDWLKLMASSQNNS